MKNSKKARRRSVSVIFTLVLVALVLAANIVYSAVSEKNLLYIDLTKEKLYSVSDTTKTLFSEYVEPQLDRALADGKIETKKGAFKIIFLSDEDTVSGGYVPTSDYNNVSESFSAFFKNNDIINARDALKQVYELAKYYEKEFGYVEVECVDPDKNPDLLESYVKHTVDEQLSRTQIIISDYNGTYNIYPYTLFFRKDSSNGYKLFAFSGESRITTSILSFCTSGATAAISTGHGETTESLTAFRDLLDTVGFEVRDIDLTQDELDSDETRLLIVNSPKTDFLGVEDEVNEIAKLDNFLDNGGHLMVFLDYKYSTPELETLLSDWGIAFDHALVTEDAAHSLSSDGKTVCAGFNTDNTQLGYQLGAALLDLDSLPKAVMKEAQTITLKNVNTSHTELEISPVLIASPEATGLMYDVGSADFGENISCAGQNYLVLTCETQTLNRRVNGDTVTGQYYTYLLAGGSSSYISDAYLEGNKYANGDILFTILHAMIMDDLPIESQSITFTEYQLDLTFDAETTKEEVMTWFVVMAAVIPMCFIIAGTVVYVRRRHL